MRLLKRFLTLLAVAGALGLAACSSVKLAYNQLPFLAGLWVDRYLDLDSDQRHHLKEKIQAWQSWHRREELPQWQALLRQANAALDDGVTQDELMALERAARASVERSLQHAAPLAAPLLAQLRPEQWRHLQKTLDEKAEEWRDRNTGRDAPEERSKRFVTTLERWLGDLDRPTRRQARAEAEAWHFDVPAMTQAHAQRQARTLEALRAWSRQDLAGGTAALMKLAQPLPAEQPYRDEIMASMLRLLNGMTPAQVQQVRKHWAGWQGDLRQLQAGR